MSKNIPLVETRNLKKYFATKNGQLHAVDGVNISIEKGKTLGVVGESGCGKSTLGRTVLRLLEPTGGDILYKGESILAFGREQMKEMRKKMQIIFQDPFTSLNPRMTVSEIIAEPMKVCGTVGTKAEREEVIDRLMETVGLAERFVNTYPHELDGGRRQRIGIARALAVNPEFIVCDEPVSALDVSIQAQILNLMMDLQEKMGLTYMFITHDLSVIKHISNHIAVMYLGQCVEFAETDELFANPVHPYTKALLNSIPVASLKHKKPLHIIEGEVTSPINPKPGCRFADRCPYVKKLCKEENSLLTEFSQGHFAACLRAGEF
ncbi:MAG: ATP-binding cassette domain-containing protein [Fusobacteriaceae bacterium]|jgi:peptide/nickel transport system ATP-binding protein|nr:ATP-binding cassette domain-containing protein [Fusobacteriaceae bacterium]